MFETPVVDRTANDVKQVENRINNPKGALSHTMLNRIEKNSQYLAALLNSYNYNVEIEVKTDWTREDYFRPSDLDRIKRNVTALKDVYFSLPTTPSLVTGKKTINYVDANNLEQIEKDLNEILGYMEREFIYCGVAACGQSRIWQKRFRHRKYEKYIFENLIENGNFDSINGWEPNKESVLFSIDDKNLTILGNPTQTTYTWMQTKKKISLKKNHKYYCTVDCLKSGGGITAWAMYDIDSGVSYWSGSIITPTDNLLRYPKTFEGWTFASNMSGNDGVITWNAVSTLGWNAVTNRDAAIKYKDVRDKEIKISFNVRCDEYAALNQQPSNGLILNLALFHAGAGARYKYRDQSYFSYKMSNEWQRIEYTFVANDDFFNLGSGEIDVENDNFVIGFYNYSLYEMQLRDLKIEYTDKSDVKQSKYYIATADGKTNLLLYGATYEWASDLEVKWDDLIVMDLTETFGIGNEPDLEWCNNNISYFSGEKIIRKIKED